MSFSQDTPSAIGPKNILNAVLILVLNPQTGPGHHGDDEYEYEIHHFEKFHDENTREEDLTHPEDIAHFRKHDEMDAQADYQEQMDQMPIVEQNIPQKFRRY